MPAILPILVLLFFAFVIAPALMFALAMVAALVASLVGDNDGHGWSDVSQHPTRLPGNVRETIMWCSVTGATALVLEISAITMQMRAPWKELPNVSELLGATGLVVSSITLCVATSLLRRRTAKHWDWISRVLWVSRAGAGVSLAMFVLVRMTARAAYASALTALPDASAKEPQSWLWTLPVAAACLVAAWRVEAVTERYPAPDAKEE
jgi:hypothetical protein